MRPVVEVEPIPVGPPVAPPRTEQTVYHSLVRDCSVAALLSALVLFFALELFRINLRIPLIYEGDVFFFLVIVKNIVEGHWLWFNPHLGMPFGADTRDFPLYTTLDGSVMKILALFTSEPGLIINLFWMLSIMAAAALATFAFRRLGIRSLASIACGTLYSVQPFAFYRGVVHLNLVFYLVPLLATAAIELALGRFQHTRETVAQPGRGLLDRARSNLAFIPTYAWLACIGQGLSYVYNSFFACFLFVIAGMLAAFSSRKAKSAVPAVVVVAVIIAVTAVNMSPTFFYWAAKGINPAMRYKDPTQADIYGLKIRHMLSPIPTHPLYLFRAVARAILVPYAGLAVDRENSARTPLDNENTTARLGTTGSLGFLVLLIACLTACVSSRTARTQAGLVLRSSAALTVAVVLLAEVGGFGSLFNIFVSPDVRAYNRIVVFIEFFCLVPIGYGISAIETWWRNRDWRIPVFAVGVFAFTGLMAADQADTWTFLNYHNSAARQKAFLDDEALVKRVEAVMPANAMIFQLPYTHFPADPGIEGMYVYDHARAYVHSSRLRWSWGAMDGRQGDWSRRVADELPAQFIDDIVRAGFSGLWVDLRGYPRNKTPERELRAMLGPPALTGRDGSMQFYKLSGWKGVALYYVPGIPPVQVFFGDGFSMNESDGGHTWRWSNSQSTLTLRNITSQTRDAVLKMDLQTLGTGRGLLTIAEGDKRETLAIDKDLTEFTRRITLAPGARDAFSFSCQCARIIAPQDTRSMYFRIYDLSLTQ